MYWIGGTKVRSPLNRYKYKYSIYISVFLNRVASIGLGGSLIQYLISANQTEYTSILVLVLVQVTIMLTVLRKFLLCLLTG